MQFTIGKTTVTMEFADPANHDAVASQFVSEPAVKAALAEHAASFYYRAWESDGDIDQKTVDKVIGIALEDGVDKAVDYMIENQFDVNPSTYMRHADDSSTRRLVSDFIEKFSAVNGLEEDSPEQETFIELLLEYVAEHVEEKLGDTDTSKPADFFGRGAEAKIVYIQGYESRGYLDDIYSSHADTTCQSDTVKPDRNLMLQFKLLNISPVEFVDYYRETRGQDLANPVFGEGVSDYHRRQFLENAQAWQYACAVFNGTDVSGMAIPDWLSYGSRADEMADVIRSCRDIDRPSVISPAELETVLDNSSYGGVGIWYGRVNAREVMEGLFEKSFVASGGQVGVHDFINGSGYLTNADNDVLIDLRDGKLVQEDRFSYGPESVYGFTRRATDADTKGVELSDWVHFMKDSWRSISKRDDGLYAYVTDTGGVADDTRRVYYVTTMNGMNEQEGPLDNFEICCSLDEAKTYALEALADYGPTKPNEPAARTPGV